MRKYLFYLLLLSSLEPALLNADNSDTNSDETTCFNVQSCGNGRIQGGAFVGTCMQSCASTNCPSIMACSDGVIEFGVTRCTQYSNEPTNNNAHYNAVAKVHSSVKQAKANNTIVNLGSITAPRIVSLQVPALNQQTAYSYTPSQGAFAGKKITLIVRYFTREFKKGRKNVLGLYAMLGENVEDVQHLETITPHMGIKTLDQIRPNGVTTLLPDGNLEISSKPPAPVILKPQTGKL